MDDTRADLGTAHIADAIVRLGLAKRHAPFGTRAVLAGQGLVIGRAGPVRHYGSVDVLLEAIAAANTGDVLIADNGGRLDESCIGDLTAAEAQLAGIRGIVIFGAHRDTSQLRDIGLPVWSLGSHPFGPTEARARPAQQERTAQLGTVLVTQDDWIAADEDGVVVFADAHKDALLSEAGRLASAETAQRRGLTAGKSLRQQLRFADFLAKRRENPCASFREHLAHLGGAIET